MGATLSVAHEHASEVVAGSSNVAKPTFGEIATSCKSWMPGLANTLWPRKPAPILHYLTGAPERTCYEWVRGKVDPPSRALIGLLHSDQGWWILEYIMRGCTQRWWLETLRARECSIAYEARREQLSLPL